MAEFNTAFERMASHEGGYANHKSDRGAETYRGIARRFHPAWAGWAIVDSLRKEPGFPANLANHPALQELVRTFYRQEFWTPLRANALLMQPIANELFDTAVNMGISTAVSFAQRALNLLNRNQQLYDDTAVDARMGPATIALLNDFPDTELLHRTLNALQAARYVLLCEKDPSQEVFLRGWLKRCADH